MKNHLHSDTGKQSPSYHHFGYGLKPAGGTAHSAGKNNIATVVKPLLHSILVHQLTVKVITCLFGVLRIHIMR